MRTTIDKAGRLVVPKAIRDELGLEAGVELELSARDGRLEASVPATPMRLEENDDGVAAFAGGPYCDQYRGSRLMARLRPSRC